MRKSTYLYIHLGITLWLCDMQEMGFQSKTITLILWLLTLRTNIHFKKLCFGHVKVKEICDLQEIKEIPQKSETQHHHTHRHWNLDNHKYY